MKVLLVQINVPSERNPLVYPLGLSYVGSALKLKNYQVEILDLNVMQDPLVALREKIMEMDPEIVGLSLKYASTVTSGSVEQCQQITKEIRKVGHSRIKILIGGTGFSVNAEKLMKNLPEIDYGVFNEGEESTPELLENLENPETIKGILFRKKDKIIFSGERRRIDLRAFPIPRRDLADMIKYLDLPYILGVQTKRGCVVKCIYCAYPNIDGTSLRLRHPEHVVDEIDQLVNLYGVKSIAFVDNVFNIPLVHAEQICRNIIKRKVDVQWTAWFHPKYVSMEFVELAREAGCNRFEFSPDGFSDRALRNLGKNMTKRDIVNTYNIIKDMKGVEVRYNFFFWPPGQNLATFFETTYFKLKLKLTFGRRLLNSKFAAIVIDPNTKLYKIALQKGIIKEDRDLFVAPQFYWTSKWIGMLYKIKEALRRTVSLAKKIILR